MVRVNMGAAGARAMDSVSAYSLNCYAKKVRWRRVRIDNSSQMDHGPEWDDVVYYWCVNMCHITLRYVGMTFSGPVGTGVSIDHFGTDLAVGLGMAGHTVPDFLWFSTQFQWKSWKYFRRAF